LTINFLTYCHQARIFEEKTVLKQIALKIVLPLCHKIRAFKCLIWLFSRFCQTRLQTLVDVARLHLGKGCSQMQNNEANQEFYFIIDVLVLP